MASSTRTMLRNTCRAREKCDKSSFIMKIINKHYFAQIVSGSCSKLMIHYSEAPLFGKRKLKLEKNRLFQAEDTTIWNKACPNMNCTAYFLETKLKYFIYLLIYAGDAILTAKCRLVLYLECGKYMP